METLFFVITWASLAWIAGRPMARHMTNETNTKHEALTFLTIWGITSLIMAFPAFLLTLVWPLTLLAMVVYAVYMFVPGAKPFFARIEAKIEAYLN